MSRHAEAAATASSEAQPIQTALSHQIPLSRSAANSDAHALRPDLATAAVGYRHLQTTSLLLLNSSQNQHNKDNKKNNNNEQAEEEQP